MKTLLIVLGLLFSTNVLSQSELSTPVNRDNSVKYYVSVFFLFDMVNIDRIGKLETIPGSTKLKSSRACKVDSDLKAIEGSCYDITSTIGTVDFYGFNFETSGDRAYFITNEGDKYDIPKSKVLYERDNGSGRVLDFSFKWTEANPFRSKSLKKEIDSFIQNNFRDPVSKIELYPGGGARISCNFDIGTGNAVDIHCLISQTFLVYTR